VKKDGQIGSEWATSAIIRIFMISDRTNIKKNEAIFLIFNSHAANISLN